jgi:WD40 repeat protein
MPQIAMTPYKHSIYEESAEIPYKSKRHLGQGKFGAVDEVELWNHVSSQQKRTYARKKIKLSFSTQAQQKELAAIRNEVEIIKRAEHIHIVKLFETYICGREFAIILEPVAEGTLKDLLEPQNPGEWSSIRAQLQEQAPQWFGCLIGGLSYLHNNNIRHRDIKPANILILSGKVLLTDFGISFDLPENTLSTYTNTGGTPKYRAPEAATGKRFGRWGDVFSLGAVFLEILTTLVGHDVLSNYNDTWPGAYADKLYGISDWIDNIETSGPRNHWYRTLTFICKIMLQYDPLERPTADEIYQCWRYRPFTALPPTSCYCNPAHDDSEWIRIVESANPEDVSDEEPWNQEAINTSLQRAVSNGHRLVMAILIGQGASVDALTLISEMEHPDMLKSIPSLVSMYGKQKQGMKVEELVKAGKGRSCLLQTLRGHSGSVFAIAFSLHGKILASASNDCTIRLWNPTTGVELPHGKLEGHADSVMAVAFFSDKLIASASRDCTLRLWDIATEIPHEIFQVSLGSIWAVAFSPDGKIIASTSNDYTVQLRDTETGALRRTLMGHSDIVWSVAFSLDGKRIASASREYVQLWDSVTGDLCGTLRGFSGLLMGLAFSPDAKLIASASDNHFVYLWDLATGAPPKILEGHLEPAVAVAFSPDNKLIASTSYDHTIRLWDCTTGAPYKTLEGHSDSVLAVAFSLDGDLIASVSKDSTVRLWDYGALRNAQN